jgi:hypothetical protein
MWVVLNMVQRSDAPSSEALLLAVLAVVVLSTTFATLMSGASYQCWFDDKEPKGSL